VFCAVLPGTCFGVSVFISAVACRADRSFFPLAAVLLFSPVPVLFVYWLEAKTPTLSLSLDFRPLDGRFFIPLEFFATRFIRFFSPEFSWVSTQPALPFQSSRRSRAPVRFVI